MLTTHSKQYANRPSCSPTIDASLGVGMVGGVKKTVFLAMVVVMVTGCISLKRMTRLLITEKNHQSPKKDVYENSNLHSTFNSNVAPLPHWMGASYKGRKTEEQPPIRQRPTSTSQCRR